MLRGIFSVVLCLVVAGLSTIYGQERCADKLNMYNQDQEKGRIMPGRPVPRCDEDGNYGPIQCVGSVKKTTCLPPVCLLCQTSSTHSETTHLRCHCANKKGERLYSPSGYLYMDNKWEESPMDCRIISECQRGCAREEYEYQQSGQKRSTFSCRPNGSY